MPSRRRPPPRPSPSHRSSPTDLDRPGFSRPQRQLWQDTRAFTVSRRGIGMRVRGVVKGHARKAKAVFASEGQADSLPLALIPGAESHRLWGADEAPTFPDDGRPTAQPSFFPPVGGYRFAL